MNVPPKAPQSKVRERRMSTEFSVPLWARNT